MPSCCEHLNTFSNTYSAAWCMCACLKGSSVPPYKIYVSGSGPADVGAFDLRQESCSQNRDCTFAGSCAELDAYWENYPRGYNVHEYERIDPDWYSCYSANPNDCDEIIPTADHCGIVGVCCVLPSMVWPEGTGACEAYVPKTCCDKAGGVWKGIQPSAIGSCAGNCPHEPSCCGCDWCCDQVSDAACKATRTYPWENLPEPHTTECVGTNKDQCPVTPQKPVCRYEEFAVGKRPVGHKPPVSGWHTGQEDRHELHSVNPIRAIDYADGTNECRTYYASVGKGALQAPASRFVGYMCGQYLRTKTGDAGRGLATKLANRCFPSKRPDGRHSFNCHYRVPCPEKPTVCL